MGEVVSQPSVVFLGHTQVIASQSRLHVASVDPELRARKCSCKNCVRVALNKNRVRVDSSECFIEPCQSPSHLRQGRAASYLKIGIWDWEIQFLEKHFRHILIIVLSTVNNSEIAPVCL